MLVNAQKLQSQWGCREIVGMEQPSDDTPSVSPCGLPAPSEREPGTPSSSRVPFIVSPGNHDVAGDFHRPYATQKILDFTIHRAARKPEGGGRFSSPLRNSDDFGFYHSTQHPEILRFIAYCAVRRADRAQMWAAASLGMCWRWDWRMWASWAGLSSRARAFSSSPRRRTAGTAMEVST